MRKLISEESSEFPAFLYHDTDYAPGRKDPFKKEIKIPETLKQIEEVLKSEIENNVKKGWEKVN